MKILKISIPLCFSLVTSLNLWAQNNCDSTLFQQLMTYGSSKFLSNNDFQKCQYIVSQLRAQHCQFYIKVINGENCLISSLTLEYERICLKADPKYSVTAFIDYIAENKNSAEEQIAFSFEHIFVKYPNVVLTEISRLQGETKEQMIWNLVWGFVNNRYYGAIDTFEDNPMKAMTVYDNPPKVLLDTLNYRKIYFSLNPEIQNIYPRFKNEIESVLNLSHQLIKFDEEQRKNK